MRSGRAYLFNSFFFLLLLSLKCVSTYVLKSQTKLRYVRYLNYFNKKLFWRLVRDLRIKKKIKKKLLTPTQSTH